MRFWLSAMVAIAVLPLGAHHPVTPFYDGSKPAVISGAIVELRAVNPHTVLVVEGTAPDGRTGRWAFEGLPPNAIQRRHSDFRERLKPGTAITISGWPAEEPQARAFSGGEITFADGTTMHFGSAPDENRWSCDSPCSYTYPELR